MTFQENASYTDAFYRVFGTGVEFANTAFDKRMTWQGMFYRDDFARAASIADRLAGFFTAKEKLLEAEQNLDGAKRKLFHGRPLIGAGG